MNLHNLPTIFKSIFCIDPDFPLEIKLMLLHAAVQDCQTEVNSIGIDFARKNKRSDYIFGCFIVFAAFNAKVSRGRLAQMGEGPLVNLVIQVQFSSE